MKKRVIRALALIGFLCVLAAFGYIIDTEDNSRTVETKVETDTETKATETEAQAETETQTYASEPAQQGTESDWLTYDSVWDIRQEWLDFKVQLSYRQKALRQNKELDDDWDLPYADEATFEAIKEGSQ